MCDFDTGKCRLKVLNVCNARATETHFYNFKMIYSILDELIKSRFLFKAQKQKLIIMKNNLEEKENNLSSHSQIQ